jgi:hypothetical protein
MAKIVIDTIERIIKLMDKHWDAKSYVELTDEENAESRFLFRRVLNFSVLERKAPEKFHVLGITQKEVMIMNNYLDWLKSIRVVDED